MNLASRVRSWARSVLHRTRLEREMNDEMRFHVDAQIADLIRSGVPAPEARRRARLAFGSADAVKEECREALGLRLVDELRSDLRYSLRQLRRSPAFTAVAIISLALGIGANAAILSLMEAALWSPLPVPNPEQLRLFSWVSGRNRVMGRIDGRSSLTPGGDYAFSYPVFLELQQHTHVLDTLFAFKPVDRLTAIVDGNAEVLSGELVTGRYFEGLRLRPVAGRPLGDLDDDAADEAAAVISDGYWARRFGRDPSAVGRRISVNGVPVTIVGVNPPWFTSAQIGNKPDIFLPLRLQPIIRPEKRDNATALMNPDRWWLLVMGRLRAHVKDPQAEAELDAVFRRAVPATLPGRTDRDQPRLVLESGARGLDLLTRQYSRPLLVLISLVAVLLLIACANVASLLLARAAVREREVSLRLALGASRWRVARQLLSEGLVLAFLAGGAGILLGFWLRDSIPALLATSWRSGPLQAEFNWRVLGLAVLTTTATGILFSLAPAWLTTRVELNPAMKAATSPSVRSHSWRGTPLVVAQVGLSILLLIGAGLFVRTLWNLGSVELGFQPDRVLLFVLNPPPEQYEGERRAALLRELQERISAIPGVERASLSTRALLDIGRSITSVNPDITAPPDQYAAAWVNGVGHGFFETLGISVVAGRTFNDRDGPSSQGVTVVNEQFARQFFPDQNPVGKSFRTGKQIMEIIGVVGDARYDRLTTAIPPTFYSYIHQASNSAGPMTFAVRTAADPAGAVPAIREAVRSLDRTLALDDMRTQNDQIAATISQERLFARLSVAFAALAAALAGIGIYGILANEVARRTREIGIRIALGARREWLVGMIARETALVAATGTAIGIAAALGLTRYVRSLLFGIEPIDLPTIAAAALVMLGIAVLAGWLPARRASRLEPMAALRHE